MLNASFPTRKEWLEKVARIGSSSVFQLLLQRSHSVPTEFVKICREKARLGHEAKQDHLSLKRNFSIHNNKTL